MIKLLWSYAVRYSSLPLFRVMQITKVPTWKVSSYTVFWFASCTCLTKSKFSNGRRHGQEYFKNHLPVTSDSAHYVKAVDLQNKKKNKMDIWTYFTIRQIMKLMLFILIISGTSKQHKRMPEKVHYQSLKWLGGF